MGKREPQIILKSDELSTVLELPCEGKFAAKSIGWIKTGFFLQGDKLKVAVTTAGGCSRTCPQARDRRPNCPDAIFRTTERRCNAGNTVTETTLRPPQRYSWPIALRRACR